MNAFKVTSVQPAAPCRPLDTQHPLRHYLRRSRADNTRRTYQAQWHQFETWCEVHGICALPASPLCVAAYVAERAYAGAAPASIEVTLAAIRFAHADAGITFNRSDTTLAHTLAGIRREHVSLQQQATPLTGRMLREILA